MKRFSSMFVLAIVSFLSLQAYAAPAYIIILRHGEKNSDESRHLSPKGYRRATALAKQFSSSAFEKRFGRPAALFSASDEGDRSKRSVETLEPSAKALSLKIDNSFVKGDEHELIEAIRKDENLDGKTVVISWSHTSIPRFLKQFDIEGKKKCRTSRGDKCSIHPTTAS